MLMNCQRKPAASLNNLIYVVLILQIFIGNSCGRKDFRTDFFTVTEVLSGNKIKLLNGYEVNLIGIEDNQQTYQFLAHNVVSKRVRFVFDSKSPFVRVHSSSYEKSFYAYVVLEKAYCVNSKILQDNLSEIPSNQYYLNDSLKKYMAYIGRTETEKAEIILPTHLPTDSVRYTEDAKPEDKSYAQNILYSNCENSLIILQEACDYSTSTTRDLAVSLAAKSSGKFNMGQICEVFSTLRVNWNYVEDPKGMEYFSKASHTIETTKFSGDCDDFAILMYSLITSIGGDARLVFAWGSFGGHAFAEVDLTNFNLEEIKRIIMRSFYNYEIKTIFYQEDADGNKWLNLDWWAAFPGGKYLPYDKYMVFYPRQNYCFKSF